MLKVLGGLYVRMLKAKLCREGVEHGPEVERGDDGPSFSKLSPHAEDEVMVVELRRPIGPGHMHGGHQRHLVVERVG